MTPHLTNVDVIVFDVLGTLVDQPEGLRRAIADAAPTAEPQLVDTLVAQWQLHVETRQAAISGGHQPYVGSETLDAEAAALILQEVSNRGLKVTPSAATRLASASQRLPPWPDSVSGLEQLTARIPVLALSNSEPTSLFHLSANSGMRWHAGVSANDVSAYKPAPALYDRAIEVANRPADRILMVAAHAWDLRAAHRAGMRTCYVARLVGDPPRNDDHFDASISSLAELVR